MHCSVVCSSHHGCERSTRFVECSGNCFCVIVACVVFRARYKTHGPFFLVAGFAEAVRSLCTFPQDLLAEVVSRVLFAHWQSYFPPLWSVAAQLITCVRVPLLQAHEVVDFLSYKIGAVDTEFTYKVRRMLYSLVSCRVTQMMLVVGLSSILFLPKPLNIWRGMISRFSLWEMCCSSSVALTLPYVFVRVISAGDIGLLSAYTLRIHRWRSSKYKGVSTHWFTLSGTCTSIGVLLLCSWCTISTDYSVQHAFGES